ncbi:hypothetical protein A0H81_10836 [Grifola frondosa]|uniref:Uncharacterized protein n=1 Tax=Grifola frondosa TaxID=5627 RepID=A0A1C7LY95_GRIFR|nr:hypothetical protein A0H81_10836 [Grifola frondosa]
MLPLSAFSSGLPVNPPWVSLSVNTPDSSIVNNSLAPASPATSSGVDNLLAPASTAASSGTNHSLAPTNATAPSNSLPSADSAPPGGIINSLSSADPTATSSSTSPIIPKPSKPTSSRKSKQVDPSLKLWLTSEISAMNVCGHKWHVEHPERSKKDFKAYWKTVSKDVKSQYGACRKAMKAEYTKSVGTLQERYYVVTTSLSVAQSVARFMYIHV